MPVNVVPYAQGIRRHINSKKIKPKPFILQLEAFPSLRLSGPRGQEKPSPFSLLQGDKTWADVVHYGVPPVIEDVQRKPPEFDSSARIERVAARHPDSKFHRFLDLPKELRLKIWAVALHGYIGEIEIRKAIDHSDRPSEPKFLPDVCYLSTQLFEETVAVVIEGAQLMLASIRDHTFLTSFLEASPGRYSLVRQLNFNYFSRFKEGYVKNTDLELAVKCQGLRTIKLNFNLDQLTQLVLEGDYDDGLTRYPLEDDRLFAKYRLKRLLDCAMLNKVIIEHSGPYVPAAVEAAEGLGSLIEREFANKSPKQMVEVVYTRQARRNRAYWHTYW